MEEFEARLAELFPVLQRYVHFRIGNHHDAEDVLQETCAAAAAQYRTLRKQDAFKAWLLGIARNKCADHYRSKAKRLDIPLERLEYAADGRGLCGKSVAFVVRETLEALGSEERRILYLYYFKQLPQDQIAALLKIPLGTVKSRLHYAKQHFREQYPYPPKGEKTMNGMPEWMPKYTITPVDEAPFPVRCEEIMGWFIVPCMGEKLTWAAYDWPERRRTETMTLEVTGKAMVHGLEGVEISCKEFDPMDCNSAGGQDIVSRVLVAQLTDTHCRLLAESHYEDGVHRYTSFLDGDDFLDNWGYGEDNCGNAIPSPTRHGQEKVSFLPIYGMLAPGFRRKCISCAAQREVR